MSLGLILVIVLVISYLAASVTVSAATGTVSVTAVSALPSSSSSFLCCLVGFDLTVGISDGPPSAAPGEPFRQPHRMVESSSARGQ
jgi:hypothetical protein